LAAASQIDIPEHAPAISRPAPEFDLLRGCCTAGNRDLSEILASPLNWERLLKLADRHRLLPVLFAALRDRDDVPASIRSAIEARHDAHILKTLRFSAELARISRHLADRGIETLAHKGPVLSQTLYGDPAMRQFGDLDLLIRARDVPRARSALTELGYTPGIQLSRAQENFYLLSGYEYVFGVGAEPNLLELQWQTVPRFYSIDFDMEALFARSVESEIEGFPLRSLGSEDLMLVLCVHAAKHEWSQLGMLRDIATLAGTGLDWTHVVAEARRLGIARLLGISLNLARELWDVDIPRELAGCAEGQDISATVSEILFRLADGTELETESLRYFSAMMNTRERWQDRARMAWRLASTPSVGEWKAVRLPDFLFPLYRVVRLSRLARRFIAV
jgi:hypothetical protein